MLTDFHSYNFVVPLIPFMLNGRVR